jgi:hypothetical protein
MNIISKEETKKIIELYESGLSQVKVGKIVGRHRETISRVLRNNSIEITPRRGREKNENKTCVCCNNDFRGGRNRCDTCNTKIRRYRMKKKAVEYLGCTCKRCGWYGDLSGFDFHHLRDKEFNINASTLSKLKWEVIRSELDKCELLCALCHREEHSDYKNVEKWLNI